MDGFSANGNELGRSVDRFRRKARRLARRGGSGSAEEARGIWGGAVCLTHLEYSMRNWKSRSILAMDSQDLRDSRRCCGAGLEVGGSWSVTRGASGAWAGARGWWLAASDTERGGVRPAGVVGPGEGVS